jgi:hypothetical protein
LIPSSFSPDSTTMKDLPQGSVLSHALTMAVPIFAGLVLVLLCGLIDLGGLGEAAIAGIGAPRTGAHLTVHGVVFAILRLSIPDKQVSALACRRKKPGLL